MDLKKLKKKLKLKRIKARKLKLNFKFTPYGRRIRWNRFGSLHNHSYFSLLDAVMSPEEVVQQAKKFGFHSVALSEHGNCFSFVRGYKEAQKLGLNFIVGCEVYETTNMLDKTPNSDRYHLILLAKNDVGVKNLFKIITEGNTTGFYGKPRIELRTMKKYSEGIVAMTACLGSRISRLMYNDRCSCCNDITEHVEKNGDFQPKYDEAMKWIQKYKNVFGEGNVFIELQNHDTEAQAIANKRLLRLSELTNTPYTITFDTHLRDGSDIQKDVHRKFIQIGQDREVGETYEGCWQVPVSGIHAVMDKQIGWEAVEKGIRTTGLLAKSCKAEIKMHQDLMPHVKIPKPFKNEQEYLKHLVNEGWKKRGINNWSKAHQKVYMERLRHEFEVLDYLGYCSYFVMLKQLVDKLRERRIPLGYSRGSGGNCLTLYMIGVTEVDSIRWGLDFSRFGNKGRKGSPADYDMDMSQLRRQEVLEIATELFGAENIAQVATFNSMSPKVAIKDLGKVFTEEGIYDLPYSIRDKMAKLIPDGYKIEEALEKSADLRAYAKRYPLLFEYATYLQNIPKSVGTHAAAVVITPRPVVEFCPLMYNKDGNVTAQLDMYNIMDDLGLVKMDFLG